MERDYRLTGAFREQCDAVEAPLGYERESIASSWYRRILTTEPVNSRWKVYSVLQFLLLTPT